MNMPTGKILIVDDDPKLRRALHSTLHSLGFEVMESPNGEQALKDAKNHKVDVVLLDINMPGMGGIETCRELRRSALRLQILMLTVRDSEEDKIKALDAGADDYVTKPFSVPELAARIRAAIRRATTPATEGSETLVIGEIELDPARRTVRKAGNLVRLTPKEFELLHYLMAHAGLPVTHARLLHTVWGAEYSLQREYLRTFIHELRKKLEDDPASPRYLLTEAYVGYRFAELEPGTGSHSHLTPE
jgi:two-component system, OmpR family, KDP operon response regulator KdpE